MRLLVMAGGTGGHVFPAMAVAKLLRDEGVEVLWMGTANGFEARAVPEQGFATAWIDVAGVRGKGLRSVITAPLQIARAVFQAIRIIRGFKPKLVLGMGGYAAGPGGLAAWLLNVPLLIHEQNAAAGTTNKLLARMARDILQAYPRAFGARGVTVGNPVRAELTNLPVPAQRQLAQRGPVRILVLGGSLGALSLNQTVPASLAGLMSQIEVRHQAGRTLVTAQQAWQAALGEPLPDNLSVTEFIKDMADALSWADLLICRAGALTLAEIAAVGVPSVLVPFPHAIDDHQTRNAEHLVEAGAALLMPEASMTADSLKTMVEGLIASPSQLLRMAEAARSVAVPDSTNRIANFCRPYLGLPIMGETA